MCATVPEPPKLSQASRKPAKTGQKILQEKIIELILQRQMSPGDLMPSEQELMAELGAGRNTVREAMKVLDAAGIVEIRHGFGTFVSNDALTPMVRALTFRGRLSLYSNGREALELVDVRQALETGLIAFVASVISDEELEQVRVAAQGIAEAASRREPIAYWDQRFHAALFAPLGNELLSGLLDVFWQVYNNIAVSLDRTAPLTDEDYEHLMYSHNALYEAVATRNAVDAVQLMGVHFEGIRGRLENWSAHIIAERGSSGEGEGE